MQHNIYREIRVDLRCDLSGRKSGLRVRLDAAPSCGTATEIVVIDECRTPPPKITCYMSIKQKFRFDMCQSPRGKFTWKVGKENPPPA